MPRRSRRLNPPCHLDGLSDDLVLRLFSRAPFMAHGTLHGVCRRLKTLLRSPEFLQQRVDSGLVEHGLVVAGGWRVGRAIASCSMFTGGRWRPITPMSGPRAGACSAIVEDEDGQPEMWVMGGCDDSGDSGDVVATVEAYNPRTNVWRSCQPLSRPREGAVAGVISGHLVVAGGCGAGCNGEELRGLTSVEAYSSSGWTPLPALPHAAYGGIECVLEGRLYVMGGWECNKLQVLEWKEEENGFSWTVKADLPAECYNAAAGVVDGKLWLIGGARADLEGARDFVTDVNVYDPAVDTWAVGTPLPRAGECTATVHAGEIHVFLDDSILVYRDAEWQYAGACFDVEGATRQSIVLG